MADIVPTIGRKIWYWPTVTERLQRGLDTPENTIDIPGYQPQPFDATIVFVHGPDRVNLRVTDHLGRAYAVGNVQLVDEPMPGHATWMPYQKGQAAKTETTEKTLANLKDGLNQREPIAERPKYES